MLLRKSSYLLGLVLLLAACTKPYHPYQGTVKILPGAEVYYQAPHALSSQPYEIKGKRYPIIKQPIGYSVQGTAQIMPMSQAHYTTLIHEQWRNEEFVGAHPSLPLPSYVSVTNMNNGRRTIVRLIDRQPVSGNAMITLSPAVADQLLLTPLTPIQIDYIDVSSTGAINGKLAVAIDEVRKSYPLPQAPEIKMP